MSSHKVYNLYTSLLYSLFFSNASCRFLKIDTETSVILIFRGNNFCFVLWPACFFCKISSSMLMESVTFFIVISPRSPFAAFTMDLTIQAWGLCSITYLGWSLLLLCTAICRY